VAKVEATEQSMRADPGKQRKYERLLASPYFAGVVEANRAYLAAAVADPSATERDYWTMSCLPGGASTLSRISMGIMETFVVHTYDDEVMEELGGFVVVVASVLEQGFGSMARFEAEFPDVHVERSNYRAAGPDQVRVWASHSDLLRALALEGFARSARALAERLMQSKTVYRGGHNYMLADHVLGRRSTLVSTPGPRSERPADAGDAVADGLRRLDPPAAGYDRPYAGPIAMGEFPNDQATNGAAHEASRAEHHRVCARVLSYLTSQGVDAGQGLCDVPVDLAWRDRAGKLLIAEVKSCADGNDLHQLRLGLGQVLEYRTRLASIGVDVEAVLITNRVLDTLWYDVCDDAGVILVDVDDPDGITALDACIEEPAILVSG
jgi:hypothetical protein